MTDLSTRFPSLTPRQLEVCELTTRGLCVKEVGRELGISHRTIEDHRKEIYRKVGVRNAVELTRKLFEVA